MELTLGPILYEWSRDEVDAFYEEAACMPVDTICLGEVVCSKKRGITPSDISQMAKKLTEAGKKVVVSTLAVVSNDEELEHTKELASLGYTVEANDTSALAILEGSGRLYAGPHIKTYNLRTMEFLKAVGVERVTFPVELPAKTISRNIKGGGIEGEVFAHGKLPLAFSWRCYTLRSYGLTKSECGHQCLRHPDGIETKTLDRERLFTINGTSILSAKTFSLVERVEELKDMGVASLRISPQRSGTKEVARIFRGRLEGSTGPVEGLRRIIELSGTELVNGYFDGAAGKDYLKAAEAALA